MPYANFESKGFGLACIVSNPSVIRQGEVCL